MRPDATLKPPNPPRAQKSAGLAYFRNDHENPQSEGENRRFCKAWQYCGGGVEDGPSPQFTTAPAIKHGFGAGPVTKDADKPATLLELAEIHLRRCLGRPLKHDCVIGRALRPAACKGSACNSHVRLSREDRARGLYKVIVLLQRHHLAGDMGEHGGAVTGGTADIENAVA